MLGVAEMNCYRVLIMLPFGSRSHKNVFDPIAEELVRRGHEVTMLSAINGTKDQKGITNVFMEDIANAYHRSNKSFFQGTASNPGVVLSLIRMISEMCNITYQHPVVTDIVQNPRNSSGAPKYDLVVVDTVLNEFVLPLAHHMGVPAIYLSPSIMFPYHAWALNIPLPFSYVPSLMDSVTSPMTFWQRGKNAVFSIIFMLIRNHYVFRKMDAIIEKVLPGTPSLVTLENRVSFIMTNTHPGLYPVAPHMPYYVEIGCIHCKPSKKLPKDLEDFMNSAGKEGVIYFSLGSATQGITMPLEMRNKVMQAFSKLPQKILWKFEKDIEGLPKNIKLTKWAPQQDLLAHPQLRLFITHSGGLSTQESAYHGSPILGFPLSADQWGNIAHAKKAGYAEYLDWRTFTSDEFYELIQKMLKDSSYKENAARLSNILQDQLDVPVQRASYWIEYVIRHKGASHLKSGAENLNFFQYFLLDVIGVLVFLLFNVFLFICFVIHQLIKCWRRRVSKSGGAKPTSSKKKKNKTKQN